MKKIVLLLTFFSSCNSLQKIDNSNINSVSILYESSSWNNYDGYTINNDFVIWDKNNKNVKIALDNNIGKLSNLKNKDANYLLSYIQNKKVMKYNTIKVVPLREFGYVKFNNGEILYYGIMGERTFIDLTNNIVYY